MPPLAGALIQAFNTQYTYEQPVTSASFPWRDMVMLQQGQE
jgi:hypothetical protein